MAKKEKVKKEPLKQRNPYKYYRNAYYACQDAEWACILTPIIAIFGVKWQEYFDFTESSNGVRLTIGCVLALVMASIFIYKKVKHQEKMEGKVTMLSYVIGVGVAFAFSYLFKVVIDDLFLILGCEFAGAVGAYGIDFATSENQRKAKLYKDSIEKLEADESAVKVKQMKEQKREKKKEVDIV